MAQLEDYFDKQSELPNEVTRALRLIKELDEKVQTQTEQIEALKPEGKKDQITKLYDENINLTQEKIQIADKLYQMVDKAVQDLDDDLKRFEDNIKNSMAPDHKRRFLLLSKYQKEKRKKINLEIEQCKEIFQNTAASEPLYCHCQKPSFGQMIMCDNQLCQKEWFHLECVRLKDFPSQNTQWYCSGDCRREGRNRLKR